MKSVASLSYMLMSALVVLFTSYANADISYYRDNNGNRVTAQRFGDTTYYRDNNGNRATAQQFGNTTYIRKSDGNRITAQQFGDTTYFRDSNGNRGTAQQFGDTTYYRDSEGNRATIQRFGDSAYIRSNNINGSVQRFGNNAQVNVQQNNYARRNETSYSDSDDADYYQPRNTVVQQNNGDYAKRQTNYSQPQRQTSSYAKQTSSKSDDLSLGDSPVLNTSVSAIYLSREEVELASGDTIKFLSKSKQMVRSWRNNDTILVYEVKSNGFVIGYQLYNTNRKSSAFGTLK